MFADVNPFESALLDSRQIAESQLGNDYFNGATKRANPNDGNKGNQM
jgi:hypothetical protein